MQSGTPRIRPLQRLGALLRRGLSIRTALVATAGLALVLLPLASDPTTSAIVLSPYAPRSAHQAHGYSIAQTRLASNSRGSEWFAAAERALLEPERMTPPFDAALAFAVSGGGAHGYAFAVRDGRRLRMELRRDPVRDDEIFVDVFRATPRGLEHVTSAWPAASSGADFAPIEIDVLEAAEYRVRVQPALASAERENEAHEYTVRMRIATSPLLVFPVEGTDARAIWSGFGAARDGGVRSHRGVDVFAPRGTTAVAATDAWVVRVETTRIGGNVVWLQPLFGNMRLYYAHLDEQYVERGQFVLAGEPIGAIGNTGNAATTPPHLHFGVYVRQPGVRGGARDPVDYLR